MLERNRLVVSHLCLSRAQTQNLGMLPGWEGGDPELGASEHPRAYKAVFMGFGVPWGSGFTSKGSAQGRRESGAASAGLGAGGGGRQQGGPAWPQWVGALG